MDFECQEDGYLAQILIPSNSKDVAVGKVGFFLPDKFVKHALPILSLNNASANSLQTKQPLAILVDDAKDVPAFASYNLDSPSSSTSTPTPTASPPPTQSAPPDLSKFPAHNVIGLPAMSPTMDAGNVGAWKKAEGDKVNPGDVLVEVETDKAQVRKFPFPAIGLIECGD